MKIFSPLSTYVNVSNFVKDLNILNKPNKKSTIINQTASNEDFIMINQFAEELEMCQEDPRKAAEQLGKMENLIVQRN